MTAKFILTRHYADFAYNPDFAQVEADAPGSTPQRFRLFQKTPFLFRRTILFNAAAIAYAGIADPI